MFYNLCIERDHDVGTVFQEKVPPQPYRGTSLIRNSPPLGPYRRTKPRAFWWSQGRRLFLMSEVTL